MLSREAAIEAAKEAAKKVRRKKKRTASSTSLASNTFQELYRLTGEVLGQGAYASVQTCVNIYTEVHREPLNPICSVCGNLWPNELYNSFKNSCHRDQNLKISEPISKPTDT